MDPIAEVKVRAELLQHRIERGDPAALAACSPRERGHRPQRRRRPLSPPRPRCGASTACQPSRASWVLWTMPIFCASSTAIPPRRTSERCPAVGRAARTSTPGIRATTRPRSISAQPAGRSPIVATLSSSGPPTFATWLASIPSMPTGRPSPMTGQRPADLAARRRLLYGLLFAQAPRLGLAGGSGQALRVGLPGGRRGRGRRESAC